MTGAGRFKSLGAAGVFPYPGQVDRYRGAMRLQNAFSTGKGLLRAKETPRRAGSQVNER